jgi:DNA-binding GntR family transcriptional regulator
MSSCGSYYERVDEQDTYRRPPTAQRAVLAELRRSLVSGELRPGTRIQQEKIADTLGVSRHPVREALKVLEGEGQIQYIPQRGYYVADLDPTELQEIYLLREILENQATVFATPRFTDETLRELTDIYEQIDETLAAEDISAMTAVNRRFHFTLLTPCELPRLMRLVSQLWDQSNPFRYRHFADPANRMISQQEHKLMIEAAVDRDTDRLIELSNQHRAHAVPALRRAMKLP